MPPRGRPPKVKKTEEKPLGVSVPEVAPEPVLEPEELVSEELHDGQNDKVPEEVTVAETQPKTWSNNVVLSVHPHPLKLGYYKLDLLNGSTTIIPEAECELYNLL